MDIPESANPWTHDGEEDEDEARYYAESVMREMLSMPAAEVAAPDFGLAR